MIVNLNETSVDYYNVITDYHINLFANGILTSCRLNNIYPIKNMKFVKSNLMYNEQKITSEYLERLEMYKLPSIIFLDHQGVIFLGDNYDCKLLDFDKKCVENLNKILNSHPSIEIVVSSDWKYWTSLDDMKKFYRTQGIIKSPIDYTPNINRNKKDEIMSWLQKCKYKQDLQWIAIDNLKLDISSNNFIQITTGIPDHLSFIKKK
jgi:hypothetical protein